MPIYEYRCESCGHELEALQKMNDPLLTECPECKQETLKKALSAAGFRLKGSGWYETDFKNGKKKSVQESRNNSDKQPAACSGGGCACHS
jgi:putative FmdB family regulatory protein